ncbi:hypothetical protein D9M72_554020 [compost metagenome]
METALRPDLLSRSGGEQSRQACGPLQGKYRLPAFRFQACVRARPHHLRRQARQAVRAVDRCAVHLSARRRLLPWCVHRRKHAAVSCASPVANQALLAFLQKRPDHREQFQAVRPRPQTSRMPAHRQSNAHPMPLHRQHQDLRSLPVRTPQRHHGADGKPHQDRHSAWALRH